MIKRESASAQVVLASFAPMSVAKGIVEKHGGRLALDPAADHTRMVMVLPKAAAAR